MKYVYAIGTETKQKIGFSANVEKRLKQLQTGNPDELKINYVIEVPDDQARSVETIMHKDYNYLRIKGEWFDMPTKKVIELLEHARIRWVD